jgi:hypothetical protein
MEPINKGNNIQDILLRAKNRHQPYVSIVDKKYEITDLLDPDKIKEYQALELKSLYYQTKQLKLDKYFAERINELTEAGIREVFIFCDEDLTLNNEAFSKFLQEHNIRINLRIAPVSPEKVQEIINSDTTFKRNNILIFNEINLSSDNKTYELIYNSGNPKVSLLNSPESDRIILNNYNAYKAEIAKNNPLFAEPKYIDKSLVDKDMELRYVKIPLLKKKDLAQKVEVNAEVNLAANLEAQQDVDQYVDLEVQADKENEVQAQTDFSQTFSESDANDYLTSHNFCCFAEEFIIGGGELGQFIKLDVFFKDERINY